MLHLVVSSVWFSGMAQIQTVLLSKGNVTCSASLIHFYYLKNITAEQLGLLERSWLWILEKSLGQTGTFWRIVELWVTFSTFHWNTHTQVRPFGRSNSWKSISKLISFPLLNKYFFLISLSWPVILLLFLLDWFPFFLWLKNCNFHLNTNTFSSIYLFINFS